MTARWVPALIGAAVAVLAWLRVPSLAKDALYAEDGTIFVSGWVNSSGVAPLWRPYAGYQHLLPRLASWFVTESFPVPWWGYAVTATACVLIGGIAALVFSCSGSVIAYYPARVLAALLVVLTPLASNEPLGNLANLHWFALYLCPWLLLTTPRTMPGRWTIAVVMLLVVTTEPQCVLFLPLAAWRFLRAPAIRPTAVALLIGSALQGITYLTAPRATNPGEPSFVSLVDGYLLNGVMSLATSSEITLGSVLRAVGWWAGWAGLVAVLLVIGTGFGRGTAIQRTATAAFVAGSLATWALAFLVNNDPTYDYAHLTIERLATGPTVRWGTSASMLLAGAIVVSASVLVERYPARWWIGGGLVLLMTALMLVNYAFVTSVHAGNRQWSETVTAAVAGCGADPHRAARLPIQPENIWFFTMDCSDLTD